MNRMVLSIVACALVLSASASYLVYRAVAGRPTAAKVQTAQIVVATKDLVPGALIQDADVKMGAWLGPLPARATVKRDSLLSRSVLSPIYEGEPVTENRLSPKGSGGGLAATIPPGMRACAVKVNEVVGLAGFVVPGMRVDVLIAGLPPGGSVTDGPKVRTLLQNIQVLSAGTNFQKDQAGKPEPAQVVNLLVNPAQAEMLSLASNETHIQLVLRNPMDTEISKPPGTKMSNLFDGAGVRVAAPIPPNRPQRVTQERTPPKPIAPAPLMYTIEVSNGAVHTEANFSGSGRKQ